MDYFLTEEQKMIKERAKKIAQEEILPYRNLWDEEERFPWEVIKALTEADLMGLYIPKVYDGKGGGTLENCLAVEEISRICVGVACCYATSGLGAYPILLFSSEEQKQKYLPDIAKGKKLAAFGLTEASAGSDAASIQTQALKDGKDYLINGTKQWITNGGEADVYVIIVITDKSRGPRGASALIVERDTPGFSFGKREKKMGIRASTTRELIFNHCRVPRKNLIGKEGMGFIIAMRVLDRARPGVGAQAVGLCQGALDVAVEYARKRIQFDRPIISFQAIQHMLADIATLTEAARCLLYSACRFIDANRGDISKISAMVKLFTSDAAMKVATDAVQILGGYGYMQDYPTEKMFRDAKILQIYEGTNQIQRNLIGQHLLKEYAQKK